MQSRNDYNGDASENKAFTPFYGTNHKFNGFMDYFHVGNHANSVGLIDIYTKVKTKLGERIILKTVYKLICKRFLIFSK